MNTSPPQRTALAAVSVALLLGFVAYICAFKILDRDFWWHVKAGEIMLETRSLIHNELFSYARAGKPYLATHEWLAQILLYLLLHFTGFAGVIVFRTAVMAATLLLLLRIDKRSLWPNGLIAILAANSLKAGFIERPQLFTYALFAAYLFLACRYLEEPPGLGARRRRILWSFVALEALWVNLHGAACLLGVGVAGALFAQEAMEGAAARDPARRREFYDSGRALCLAMGGMLAAFFISPNTYRNFTYLASLMTDKTIAFISEWQPRDPSVYLRENGPFWVLGLAALAVGRRGRLFALAVWGAMGVLSVQAFRHEMLFVLAATGVIVFELKHSPAWQRFLERLLSLWRFTVPAYALIVILLGAYVRAERFAFCQKDNLFGYGVFDLGKGAYEFLEREQVRGNMFNTSGIGGYLAYRGYPGRPIYMDGRNVDFGFVFLYETYFAGWHPELWRKLEDRYRFTYAVVDYDAIREKGRLPYCEHLDKNPNWKLVYLDDWAAVYLKDIPMNRTIIRRGELRWVNPERLEDRAWIGSVALGDAPRVEAELRRVAAENPEGVKARLALARLALRLGKSQEAGRLAEEARGLQPARAEIYEILAAAAVAEQRFAEAARAYEWMLHVAGPLYPDINYAFIADVFEKAGEPGKARKYRRKAGPSAQGPAEALPEDMPKGDSGTQKLAERLRDELNRRIGKDIAERNDRGVDLARQGKLQAARREFEAVLVLDPGHPQALNNLGSVFYKEKNWPEAILRYKKALERDPLYVDALLNLARACLHAGRYEEAAEAAKKAQALGRDAAPLVRIIQKAQESGKRP